jgi:hypothetical protein
MVAERSMPTSATNMDNNHKWQAGRHADTKPEGQAGGQKLTGRVSVMQHPHSQPQLCKKTVAEPIQSSKVGQPFHAQTNPTLVAANAAHEVCWCPGEWPPHVTTWDVPLPRTIKPMSVAQPQASPPTIAPGLSFRSCLSLIHTRSSRPPNVYRHASRQPIMPHLPQ